MIEINSCTFANGSVYALETEDGYPVEVTDTFLPFYTKNIDNHRIILIASAPNAVRDTNALRDENVGSRKERWMIGVSTMSGCPVGCKFCATGSLPRWRKLKAAEIVAQVEFILSKHPELNFCDAQEHKINYTRMGEPFLNLDEVKSAIQLIEEKYPNTHHYISTIGIQGSDFSWIRDNITLQISLHSLDEDRRNDLIPITKKMSISELGKIRTQSHLRTTVNMTLVDERDFNIEKLIENFATDKFFIKVSPINPNEISDGNNMGTGVIQSANIV